MQVKPFNSDLESYLNEYAANFPPPTPDKRRVLILKDDHQEALTKRIIDEVPRDAGATLEDRFWNVARRSVTESLESLFNEIDKLCPGQIKKAEHIWMVLDLGEWAHDEISHKLSSNEPYPFTAHRRLERYSYMNDVKLLSAYEAWGLELAAIRDALTTLEVRATNVHPRRADTPVTPEILVGVCHVCWRTGFPSPRGKFFCYEHENFENDYESCLDRRRFQSKTMPPGYLGSFVKFWTQKKLRELPGEMRASIHDFSPMVRLAYGDLSGIEHAALWNTKLKFYWKHFPRVFAFLRKVKPWPNTEKPLSVLAALDPIGEKQTAIHQLMHQAMATDFRILFDRLIYVEACLQADLERNRNRGVGARVQDPNASMVEYTFTSYPHSCGVFYKKNQ